MKLTQTGLPRSVARSIVPPPTCGHDERRCRLTDVERPGTGRGRRGRRAGCADGEAVARRRRWRRRRRRGRSGASATASATVGRGRPGSGANASTPASSATAATTPTSSPATIDRRGPKGDTTARVPVRAAGGGARRPLLPCRSHGRPRGSRSASASSPPLLTALGVAGAGGRAAVADERRSPPTRCRAPRRPPRSRSRRPRRR